MDDSKYSLPKFRYSTLTTPNARRKHVWLGIATAGALWTTLIVYWWFHRVSFWHHLPATAHSLRTRFDSKIWWGYSPRDGTDLANTCCHLEGCIRQKGKGSYTALTVLSSDKYLPLVQELACSVNRTNPGLLFTVLTVQGALSEEVVAAARAIANVRFVEDLHFPHHMGDSRYGKNWLKLRAWELTEFDALILLDSDMTVLGDLNHLFELPTHVAAVLDNSIVPNTYSGMGSLQSGFILIRPCLATARHMIRLATSNKLLQFAYTTAEQEFLAWYFRKTAYALPVTYNAQVDTVDPFPTHEVTIGGMPVRALHHTQHKPWKHHIGGRFQPYLCIQK
ncbi:hypothetical protein WJX73_006503 [Symbiochloris irregularis]|uniref:Hexosyltransferase n=1 Tax=Symbiochloris irregularis TaxID=706552 RepID=A0AAW1NN18_9CHLO